MFTILADAMFTATLARRGSGIPDVSKRHADRHIPDRRRTEAEARATLRQYRDLW